MIVKVVRNDATEYVPENYTFAGTGKFCCDDMYEHWLGGYMQFGYGFNETAHTKLRVVQYEFPRFDQSAHEVIFCQWCREKITFEIKERE